MGTPEHIARVVSEPSREEILDPRHFYAAYEFQYAAVRGRDVAVLINHARRFECPIRYWWASETANRKGAKGAFDRLIVCAHHASMTTAIEMHGILRQAVANHEVAWDDFEAAKLDDYRRYGKAIVASQDIAQPDGTPLFSVERAADTNALYNLTRAHVQLVAQGMLGRVLSAAELAAVAAELPGAINWMDPVEFTIWTCQQAGRVGPAATGEGIPGDDKQALFAEIANMESTLVHAGFTEQDDYALAVRRLKEAYQALVVEMSPTERSETIEKLLARIEEQDHDVSLVMTQKAIDDYGFRPNDQGELFASSQVAEKEERANAFILDLVDSWLNGLK